METISPASSVPTAFRAGKTILALAAIILLTAALRVPLLSIPLERDEGEYAYIAWRLEHHELPYRDWVDQKPPGVFWVYRLALDLPMPPIRAIHLMGLAFSAATACSLFLMMRLLTSGIWPMVAATLLAFISADPHIQGTSANTEVFMLLPLVLSQWVFLHCGPENRRRIFLMILCGVLTGTAMAFKQVAAVNGPLLVVLYALFFGEEKRLRNPLWFAVCSGLGVVLVWGAIALYFYAKHGLDALVYNVLTHNLEYINSVPWSERLKLCQKTLGELARPQGPAWGFAVIGLVAIWRLGRMGLLVYLIEWLIASLVGVSASGYFFPHYFQQALPVLCVMAALGAETVARAGFWGKAPGAVRMGGAAAMVLALPTFFIVPYLLGTPEEASRKIYPGNYCVEMQQMGRRLAELTRPEDRVFIFGAEPEVLFYAQRVSATRYIFLFPLYGPYKDVKEKQLATAEEIAANQPAALLYLPNGLFFVKGTEQFLTQWTRAYWKENFHGDLWLAADKAGNGHLVNGDGINPPPVPPGQQVLGGLLVRKEAR